LVAVPTDRDVAFRRVYGQFWCLGFGWLSAREELCPPRQFASAGADLRGLERLWQRRQGQQVSEVLFMNKILPVLAFALLLPFVAAVNCWEEHVMPLGSISYSAWLCVSVSNHGWIYSVGPTGHPSAGRMFKVELTSFTYSSPYPATLTCYEQFTDVEPPSRIGGKSGFLNSIPPGPSYSWHLLQQVTLPSGTYTGNSGAWVLAGCPPVRNLAQQGGPPPQVQIGVDWEGFGGGGNRATAAATPLAISVFPPYLSYGDSAVSVGDGATSSVYKFVKRKSFRR